MSGRKPMTSEDFNKLMKRCQTEYSVNYISPTIHARAHIVIAIDLILQNGDRVSFNSINHPNPNYDLSKDIHDYLDNQDRDDHYTSRRKHVWRTHR